MHEHKVFLNIIKRGKEDGWMDKQTDRQTANSSQACDMYVYEYTLSSKSFNTLWLVLQARKWPKCPQNVTTEVTLEIIGCNPLILHVRNRVFENLSIAHLINSTRSTNA